MWYTGGMKTSKINFEVYAKHSNGTNRAYMVEAKSEAEAKAIVRVAFQERFGFAPEALHVSR